MVERRPAATAVANTDFGVQIANPGGFTVIMFQHNNFLGASWTLTSDTPNFLNLSPNANDQVSSVRIQ